MVLEDADRVHRLGKMIVDHFGHSAFSGKKILDLGAGNGDLGAVFARLGATVLCVDARKENVAIINKRHPFLKTMVVDLDNSFPFEERSFDFCFSLGLMNHLKNYDKHITDIISVAENVILETEVLDSKDENVRVPIYEEKSVNYLSFGGEGSIVSGKNIQNRLSNLCATFKRIDEAKINHGQNKYDWKEKDVGRKYGNSRLYFIRRDAFWANRPAKMVPLETKNAEPIIATQKINPPTRPHTATPTSSYPRGRTYSPVSAPQPQLHKPQPQIHQPKINNFRIRLFYNYYVDDNPTRRAEIDLCFQKNIDNRSFETVVLYSEKAPTYNFFFEKINQLSNDTDINIFCHSDIFFDDTINLIANMPPKSIYALSRWEWNNDGRQGFLQKTRDHQDVWIVKGKIDNVNGDFQIGRPSSDGRIAYEFDKAGYKITNPSRSIKCYHYHNSCITNLELKKRVEGDFLLLDQVAL